MYIWSLATKRNFLRHFDIIAKKIGNLLPTFRILDQTFCFRTDHLLLEKPNKPIFHKNLKDVFRLFLGTTFENTLLVDDMFPESMFNLLCSAIFFRLFTSLTLMVITCSALFSHIWNHCIPPKRKFINL
jgi:hypothetical protein